MNTSVPAIEINDETITTDLEKANAFNIFFCSITQLNTIDAILPDRPRILNVGNLERIVISEQDVLDQLSLLNLDKAFGPDKISSRFLKEGNFELSQVLTKLFNLSLKTITFP